MSLDPESRRSRRSLLAAAAGGAAGLAAARLVVPDITEAAPVPLYINQDNATSAMTSITTNGVNAFHVTTGTQATAIWATGGSGAGVYAEATSGVAISATSQNVAVNALTGSGYAVDAGANASGGVAVRGWANTGTGVIGHVGGGSPVALAGVALQGSVSTPTQVGIRASGRVQFPDRSGKATIAAGKASVSVSVAGMTSANFAMAVLGASRSGRWVRAVACSAGKITIYLNVAVTTSTPVHWLVLG
jgi:hypothetical protein